MTISTHKPPPALHADLALVPWLRDLPGPLMDHLAAHCSRVHLHDGQPVSRRGQFLTHLVIITQGRLSMYIIGRTGKRHVLGQLQRGQVFGLIPVVEQSSGIYNAQSQGNSEVLMLAGDAFLAVLNQHMPLARALIEVLCARSRRLQDYLAARNLYPLSGQLALLLLNAAQLHGVQGTLTDSAIEIKVAQSDLADMLGVSRQSLNAELKKLEALGLLNVAYSKVHIPDVPKLRNWLAKQE